MIDVVTVASGVVTVISPFLPYLMSLGNSTQKKLEEVVTKEGGEFVWKQAKTLWEKIKGRFQDDPEVTGAATLTAAAPQNETYQQVLVQVLAKKLESSSDLAEELLKLMGGEAGVQRVIAGNEAWIANIKQKMAGSGMQEVKGGDKSVLLGIEQIQGNIPSSSL
jgi:hypothetical protein